MGTMSLEKEESTIRKTIDSFLTKLDIGAKYFVNFTKFEQWSVKFKRFSGSLGQRMLLEAHMAVRLSGKTHAIVLHWSEE